MKKAWQIASNLDLLIAGICLIVIVFSTLAGVVMRYLFQAPFQWLEELSTLFFVWLVFTGSSVAVKSGNHVSIDLLVDRFPPGLRKAVDILAYFVTLLVLGFITYYGAKLAVQVTDKITPILRISYRYIDIAMPIGAVFMIVNYSTCFIQRICLCRKEEEH